MPWPVHPNGLLGAQGDNDNYQISRSLRFNSDDSAYLNRTPGSASNRKTWTWSGWVKRGAIDANRRFLFNSGTAGTDSGSFAFEFFSDYTIRVASGLTQFLLSEPLYRDPSAWYHIVLSVNTTNLTTSDRIIVYVNGSRISTSSYTAPSTDLDTAINNNAAHFIGCYESGPSLFFNGYLTEINFIDGQALTPSSFGETDAITGRWKAKAYSGSYGTNGFYLKFADNSSTAALGTDSSGNGNTWTTNNFSVTAGAGNDSLVDSPTNYGSDSGVGGTLRGNYATLNPLHYNYDGVDLRNGNLDGYGVLTTTTPSARTYPSTIKIKSGKWYVELTVNATSNGHDLGIANTFDSYGNISYSNGYGYNFWDQLYSSPSGSSSYGVRANAGQVVGMAVDLDNGKLEWFVNGSSQGQKTGIISGEYFIAYFCARGTAGTAQSGSINFGQRPFAYTAPTGFKALCTTNLTTPTIKKPSSYMDVVTYTGNGGTQTISSLGFSPDLVWVKGRSQVAANHILTDRVRGNGASLMSNNTNAEGTRGATLTSNGFSFTYPDEGGDANFSAATYVAWAWDAGESSVTNNSGSITSTVRANAQDGFSVVTYTIGSSGGGTIGHGLGAAPSFIINKVRSRTENWRCYHSSIGSANAIYLNSTAASTADNVWGSTAPTSTLFTIGNGYLTDGDTCVAYCFSQIEGFSKFGSYDGNGSADGPFVYCGFRPRWILVKRSDGGLEYWYLLDSQRNTSNPATNVLLPNLSGAEGAYDSTTIDFLSNGFKIKSNGVGVNASGSTNIFAAFAEAPFKYARAR